MCEKVGVRKRVCVCMGVWMGGGWRGSRGTNYAGEAAIARLVMMMEGRTSAAAAPSHPPAPPVHAPTCPVHLAARAADVEEQLGLVGIGA